jgi:periplasmic protein TonB
LNQRTFLSVPGAPWLLSFGLHFFVFSLLLWNTRERILDLTAVDLTVIPEPAAVSPGVPAAIEQDWRIPDSFQKMIPLAQAPAKTAPAPIVLPLSNGPSGGPTDFKPAAEVGQMPRFKTQIQADYPESAKRANIEGVVILQVDIDAAGEVKKVEVVQSLGYGCDEAAVAAVQRSSFFPADADGQPVPVRFRIPYRFKFED